MSGPTNGSVVCGCGRVMRVKKNSVTVEELLEDGRPYKLWDADLFECLECGVEVITGFGRGPIAEHFQPTYGAQRARLAPIYPARCCEVDAPVSYPPMPAPPPPGRREPNAHTLVLKFHRILSDEWREVIAAVRMTPHVVELEVNAVEETAEELARRRLMPEPPPSAAPAPVAIPEAALLVLRQIALTEMVDALGDYLEWNGAEHDENCPGDDTCSCAGKRVNDGVNSAYRFLSALEGRP